MESVGYSIKKEDALKYVWGATILNDVCCTGFLTSYYIIALLSIHCNIKISARDRQKLHKQFYVGKSFDTFCPMGPFVVHGESYSSIFPNH